MKRSLNFLGDFVSLVFPQACQACGRSLHRQEQILCTYCRRHLPYTGFHDHIDNDTAKQFWGRVEIKAAASFLYFKKGERVQRLLHQLKYRKQTGVGLYLGKLYGNNLKDLPGFFEADVICPLPLHRDRLRKRGYNQSEYFASGLGGAMHKTVDSSMLVREHGTGSQTARSRYERFRNMNKAFSVASPLQLRGLHVLLVDDVITTGAPLTACAASILLVEGPSVSISTIAYAP